MPADLSRLVFPFRWGWCWLRYLGHDMEHFDGVVLPLPTLREVYQ